MWAFYSLACVVIIIKNFYAKLINPKENFLDVTIKVTQAMSAIFTLS